MGTYYTAHNAAGGGTGAVGDPWTLAEAATNAVAGDLVLIKNTGTYTPSATTTFATSGSGPHAHITFRGANSDGSDDGTVATISGSSLGASTNLFTVTGNFLKFEGLRLTAATADGLSSGGNGCMFVRCRFDNNTSDGIQIESFDERIYLADCECDNNGGWGVTGPFDSRGFWIGARLNVHDNAGGGMLWSARANTQMSESLIYDNGGDGINSTYGADNVYVINGCTIWGNSGDGVQISGGDAIMITNTIFDTNGGYGFNTGTSNIESIFMRECQSHGNTSGHIDINGGNFPGLGHVYEDPSFLSETDGSEDFTPGNTNLIIGAAIAGGGGGSTYRYIGAIQPQAAAGSGVTRRLAKQYGIG